MSKLNLHTKKNKSQIVLITIGRVINKAGFDFLLSALLCLKTNGIKFKMHIVGGGECLSFYQNLSNEMGLAEQVEWHGPIYEECNIQKIMHESDLFVYGGSVGLSLIHAFSYGIPGIIHDDLNFHNPEALMLVNNYNGLLYKKNDINDFVCKVKYLNENRSKLTMMGKNALNLIDTKLGIHRMKFNFIRAVDKLIDID